MKTLILTPFLSISILLSLSTICRAVTFPPTTDRGQPSRTTSGGTRVVASECRSFCPPIDDGAPRTTRSAGTRVW